MTISYKLIRQNPCKPDCPDRNGMCHSICEKYKAWSEMCARESSSIGAKIRLENEVTEVKLHNVERVRRRLK